MPTGCIHLQLVLQTLIVLARVVSLTYGHGLKGSSLIADTEHYNVRRTALNAAAGDDGGVDYWMRLVGTPSLMGGKVDKTSIIPASKYNLKEFNVTPFENWLRTHGMYRAMEGQEPPPAPMAFICGVYVSHEYKFIFIRTRKTASTSLMSALKAFFMDNGICQRPDKTRDRVRVPLCLGRMDPEELQAVGKDPAQVWRDYLVVTSSRNAWARAASGYRFTAEEWFRRDTSCAVPDFWQFCRDPYIMGKLSNMFKCSGTRRTGKPEWNFDFFHVEPAHHCMRGDDGGLAVDYVIRYERLEEDLAGFQALVNARRSKGLPQIKLSKYLGWKLTTAPNKKHAAAAAKAHRGTAAPPAADPAYSHAPLYRECGWRCVQPLTRFYEQDLKLLGWDEPAPPPEGAQGRGAGGHFVVHHQHSYSQHYTPRHQHLDEPPEQEYDEGHDEYW